MSRLLPFRGEATESPGEPRVLDLEDEDTEETLSALSTETARTILSELYEEPQNPPELKDAVGTSLQNIHYHIEQLEEAGLIQSAGTGYSEKGTEMTVYAPASQALVLFAGQEHQRSSLKSALSRLLGGLGVLAGASLVLQSLLETYGPQSTGLSTQAGSGGDAGEAGDAGAGGDSGDDKAVSDDAAGDGGDGGNGGGDGGGDIAAESMQEEEPTSTVAEDGMEAADATETEGLVEAQTAEPSATPTPRGSPTETAQATSTPTPQGTVTQTPQPTPTQTPQPTPTQTPQPTAEPVTTSTPAPSPTPDPVSTPTAGVGSGETSAVQTEAAEYAARTTADGTPTAVDAGGAILDPVLTFFIGGLFVLAVMGTWWVYQHRAMRL